MTIDRGRGCSKTPKVVMFCRVNWLLWRPGPGWMKAEMNALERTRIYLFRCSLFIILQSVSAPIT